MAGMGQDAMYRIIVAAKGALEASAYPDVVRAIVDCRRFLAQLPEEVRTADLVNLSLERLEGLEVDMAALMAGSEDSAGESAEEG